MRCERPFPRRLPLALLGALPLQAGGEAPAPSAVVEVTAPMPRSPLVTVLDPRNPRQPVPAQDGAAFLRGIPGFAQSRRGGTDGEPVLRGMAGSRLGILVDGEETPGGCGGRMDPPTAYVFPEAYDRIVVLKGPQSVLYGPGHSAGTVLFQRTPPHWERPGWSAGGSGMAGGFDRVDRILELQGGTPRLYGRGGVLDARSGDYRDGDGQAVHSRYHRWSAHGALGWTPNQRTWVEMRGTRSDGQAAYADRGLDGVGFLRRNLGLAFETRELSALVGKVEGQVYLNDVDHLMDNGTLRRFEPAPGFPEPMVRNPRRTTRGARIAVTLYPGERDQWILGADWRSSRHDVRRSPRQDSLPITARPRIADADLASTGVFGQWTRSGLSDDRLVAGLRADQWRAEDLRTLLPSGAANPSAGAVRERLLLSGFARYERELRSGTTCYAGLGQTRRFPDYWELMPVAGVATPSAFGLRPERTTQLDFGATGRFGALKTSFSGFYGVTADYILIQSAFPQPMPGGAPQLATVARNIQASTWGGEWALSAALADPLRLDASLAYTQGENRTDHRPLGQVPPLEARLGLVWEDAVWSAGSLVRMVAPQNRFALNQGSIAGQDLGRTAGFAVFSINAGWRPAGAKGLRFSCGIDNLFDRAYAEHISRHSSPVPGYDTTSVRVNEPGRMVWVKVAFKMP